MNETIQYYDKNAEEYYRATVDVDLNDIRHRFLSFLPEGSSIVDMGCGSGRDVRAFCDMGYIAIGLDASAELARKAIEELGITVVTCNMSTWITDTPLDGIWCCAALMHLQDNEIHEFFDNLKYNLKPGGALFLSVKTGINSGPDEKGRYCRNFTREEIQSFMNQAGGLQVKDQWYTEDVLSRSKFKWLNTIAIMRGQ